MYAYFSFTGKNIKHTLFPTAAYTIFFVTNWHIRPITLHYHHSVACMCTSDEYLYLYRLQEALQLLWQFLYNWQRLQKYIITWKSRNSILLVSNLEQCVLEVITKNIIFTYYRFYFIFLRKHSNTLKWKYPAYIRNIQYPTLKILWIFSATDSDVTKGLTSLKTSHDFVKSKSSFNRKKYDTTM